MNTVPATESDRLADQHELTDDLRSMTRAAEDDLQRFLDSLGAEEASCC